MPAWNDVLKEIQGYQHRVIHSLDLVRHKYLADLHQKTGRNIIAYYSAFLTKNAQQVGITNEDLNGFMMAVSGMDVKKGLDLILHTPGGSVAATEPIVHYLRQKFDKDIRAIVPHLAMSGGTVIACSCKEIILAKHSQLGPTDPQVSGVPAAGVKKEFDRACKEVRKDPSVLPLWQTIVGKYEPTFLDECENAIKRSIKFVEKQLESVMFAGEANAKLKSKRIVKRLNDYTENKGHDKPIHIDECRDMKLKVVALESDNDLQDLVLTVHHCYMHTFGSSSAFKIIENERGVAVVKHAAVAQQA